MHSDWLKIVMWLATSVTSKNLTKVYKICPNFFKDFDTFTKIALIVAKGFEKLPKVQ